MNWSSYSATGRAHIATLVRNRRAEKAPLVAPRAIERERRLEDALQPRATQSRGPGLLYSKCALRVQGGKDPNAYENLLISRSKDRRQIPRTAKKSV